MDAGREAIHFPVTLLAVGGMQYLKGAKWFPLLQEGKAILNRTMSVIVAGTIALGIHYVWTPSPDGSHTLTIMIPSASVLLVGAFHWGSQFIYQETGYTLLQGLQNITALAKALTPPQAKP